MAEHWLVEMAKFWQDFPTMRTEAREMIAKDIAVALAKDPNGSEVVELIKDLREQLTPMRN